MNTRLFNEVTGEEIEERRIGEIAYNFSLNLEMSGDGHLFRRGLDNNNKALLDWLFVIGRIYIKNYPHFCELAEELSIRGYATNPPPSEFEYNSVMESLKSKPKNEKVEEIMKMTHKPSGISEYKGTLFEQLIAMDRLVDRFDRWINESFLAKSHQEAGHFENHNKALIGWLDYEYGCYFIKSYSHFCEFAAALVEKGYATNPPPSELDFNHRIEKIILDKEKYNSSIKSKSNSEIAIATPSNQATEYNKPFSPFYLLLHYPELIKNIFLFIEIDKSILSSHKYYLFDKHYKCTNELPLTSKLFHSVITKENINNIFIKKFENDKFRFFSSGSMTIFIQSSKESILPLRVNSDDAIFHCRMAYKAIYNKELPFSDLMHNSHYLKEGRTLKSYNIKDKSVIYTHRNLDNDFKIFKQELNRRANRRAGI